ncbi:MAG TPA: GMC family oxidoreductase [Pseudonocardiaceae bacterium]|nr:GMC family oxidoreductase [Pseudonocardiaceae bacterium]
MTDLLSAGQRAVLARVSALLVPGSEAVDPAEYVARVLPAMSADEEDALHAAIGVFASVIAERTPAALAGGTAFDLLRRLAIEAYYGGFAPDGHTGPTGHDDIGFTPPQAVRLRKDWSFLGRAAPEATPWDRAHAVPPSGADVVVVGSGAGGGVIAAELAARGVDVLLIEAGGLHPAVDHTRFELQARHRLWWPTLVTTGDDRVALLGGRCVGGSTVINTKVAMRATPAERAAFDVDLDPWYDRVEQVLGVRERADWTPSVDRVATGFRVLGGELRPVRSYTDHNCERCGSCLQGCPTNAGKSTLNTFLAPVLDRIRLLTRHSVRCVLIGDGAVRGVRCVGPDGTVSTIAARTVVLAAGALRTPQILLRSEDFVALDTPSTRLVGRTLGLHPARLVYGLFDEPQDCHMVYPITAHCLDRQSDGIVVEATTIQDPVAFAESLVDSDGRPLWGARLSRVVRDYRRWAGLLTMATDENTATVALDPYGRVVVTKRFSPAERSRLADASSFATDALRAAGARDVVTSGLSTTHMQGSVRMGSEPARSVVDPHGRSHDVRGLYVGDSSLIPVSLSVNPSLTVMALAAAVACHIAEELPT